MALEVMKKARHDRKALVVLSDGGDNRSRRTLTAIKGDMLEADVQLYAMGIYPPEGPSQSSREESKGPELLEQLAELTGGRHFPVLNIGTLAEVSTRIGQLLRNRYLLGTTPRMSRATVVIGALSSILPLPWMPGCTFSIARVITRLSNNQIR